MADLKLGSTVGGAAILHQGTFPLTPTGNTLMYRTYKVYTEYDKPQATNNDFVSKASGGTYRGNIRINSGVNSALELGNATTPLKIRSGGLEGGNTLVIGGGTGGIQLRPAGSEITTGTMIMLATGVTTFQGTVTSPAFLTNTAAPTQANEMTRKDYVDKLIATANTAISARVLKAGDTMTGLLTAPNLSSTSDATNPEHVPRLSQVIVKGTIINFGTF